MTEAEIIQDLKDKYARVKIWIIGAPLVAAAIAFFLGFVIRGFL